MFGKLGFVSDALNTDAAVGAVPGSGAVPNADSDTQFGLARGLEGNAPKKRVCLALFGVLLFAFTYIHQDYSWGSSVSRLDLFHAVFSHHTLKIDAYHTNTTDKALFEKHYYSDKAPGTVALAFPAFSIGTGILKLAGEPLESKRGWLVSSWMGCAGSLAILTALGAVALFAWLRRWVPERIALIVTLATYLGSMPFTYATIMFSHAFVVGLLSLALWAIAGPLERTSSSLNAQPPFAETKKWRRRDLLAGFCCGSVVASEFTAGLIVYGVFLLQFIRGMREAVRFSLAAVLPVLLIPAYSWVCFRNPFTVGYSFQAAFPEMKEGLFGIQWPNVQTAFNLLCSPARGLFFWSPFFLMAFVGYHKLYQESRRMFWFTYVFPLLQIIAISGYSWDWKAGNALGPRYLAPMLPFLALPCAFGVRRFPKLGLALAAMSMMLTGVGTVVNGTPGYQTNPLLELHLPALKQGEYVHNIGGVLGLKGHWQMVPLLIVVSIGITYLWRQTAPGRTSIHGQRELPTPC